MKSQSNGICWKCYFLNRLNVIAEGIVRNKICFPCITTKSEILHLKFTKHDLLLHENKYYIKKCYVKIEKRMKHMKFKS